MNAPVSDRWDESTSAGGEAMPHGGDVFERFFERSADAVFLLDAEEGVFVDCNQAAIELVGAQSKQQLLRARPEDLSPPVQADGTSTTDKTSEVIAIVRREKTFRFEWMMRRLDGRDVPIDVSSTAVVMNGRSIHIVMFRDISERKKAERELLELNQSLERRVAERTAELSTSEARFRALVENAPEAIVVFDGETGRFQFGNEHACRIYGIPMEKLAELTPADVSPEFQPNGGRSSELARDLMMDALAGKTPVFEWMHRQPSGRLIPTEVRLLRLPAEGQNLIRASIMDNTERKEAERAVRESEAKYRALFEGSGHGVVLHDEEQILEVNPAAVRILGRQNPEEVIGHHPRDLAPRLQPCGETSEALGNKHVEDCMRRGSARFEWLASAPDGRGIPMEVALTRIEWSGRQVIQAYITDIAERQRAQRALAESEARFSVAFQASPVFIAILDTKDGKFVLANDALVNWLGCSREQALGRSCSELGMWVDLADRAAAWEEVRTAGRVRQKECRWRNLSGELFTILLSVETITVDNAPHVLMHALDISRRKQAEVEILKSLAREKELSQLKSNFVSMVSHEFRTPLGIIQSSAELLRDFRERMQPGEYAEQLESITRNTARMAGMMEEVLVLSRLDAGKLDFKPVALDLQLFCHRIVDEVLSATNRRCTIELVLGFPLAEAEADEQLLGHIFTNLLSNAVKYSEPGATVRFTIGREGSDAVCEVRDEGIGISEGDQQQLFKAFHRGSNVGGRPGTGLGLLLVKRCTQLHRGRVQVKSAIDEGTTVTVKLPVFAHAL